MNRTRYSFRFVQGTNSIDASLVEIWTTGQLYLFSYRSKANEIPKRQGFSFDRD